MAGSSIREAAQRLNELNALCADYLDNHPGNAPPVALLRKVAEAGRDLVNAIVEHIANMPPRG